MDLGGRTGGGWRRREAGGGSCERVGHDLYRFDSIVDLIRWWFSGQAAKLLILRNAASFRDIAVQ